MAQKGENVHKNHRKRVRENFKRSGIENWQEHNVLEMLLFYSIPMSDTNEMAHNLIKECGGFVNVFTASKEQLMSVKGIGEESAMYLMFIGQLMSYYRKKKTDINAFELNSETSREYLLNLFEDKKTECFYMICLDPKNKIINQSLISEGGFEAMNVDVAGIMRTAIVSDASYVVFAHNHPSGVAIPSNADITTTQVLERMLHNCGIRMIDHVVVADGKCTSMRDGWLTGGKNVGQKR